MTGTIYPNGIDGFTQLKLVVDGSSPIEADDVNRIRNAVVAVETHHKTGMGSGASAGANDTVDIQSHIEGLGQDFFSSSHVTGCTHGSGTTAGNDIRFYSQFSQRWTPIQ